jgi:hypothetical protein
MPRDITVKFSDGTSHQYNNAPDKLTPDDIEKRTKKDYPNKKIVGIDGGKKSTEPAASKPQDTPKNQSQFSIKGLRFGMTLDEVISITQATEDDRDAYRKADNAEWDKGRNDVNYKKKYYSYGDFKKPVTSEYRALDGFSIGGSEGWNPGWEDKKLVYVHKTTHANDFKSWYELLSNQYGKVNISSEPIGTAMGFKSTNYKAYWKIKDAYINLSRYSDTISNGYLMISWEKWNNDLLSRSNQEKAKSKKDFE